MKLNRTDAFWDRSTRNDINENWDIIEGSARKMESDFNNFKDSVTEDVVDQLVDNARLDWKEPVDTIEDLPESDPVGTVRQVRQATSDGVSMMYRKYEDGWKVVQEYDATAINEVDSRLTAQLAERAMKTDISTLDARKTDKSYVDSKVQQVASGAPKGVYPTLADLKSAFPNGDAGNYVVTANGHIYNWNGTDWVDTGILYQAVGIAEKSVEIDHLGFVKKSTNLLNRDTETKGYVVSTSGVLTKNTTYCTSEFIPVKPLETYSSRGILYVAFYNANGDFLSRNNLIESGITFGIPTNANNMRLCYQPVLTAYSIQLNKGSTLLPYERGYTQEQKNVSLEDDSIKRRKLEPSLSGFNNNNTEFIFQDGVLVGLSLKENGIEVNKIEINYDANGNLVNVIEKEDGMQVTTSLNRDSNGNIIGTSNLLTEVV